MKATQANGTNRIKAALAKDEPKEATEKISIKPLNFQRIKIPIVGTAPLCQAQFTAKAIQAITATQEAGTTARSKKERKARDFDDDFKQASHHSTEGWIGHPASAFRNACIDACRVVNFKMTHAKMSIFIEADGLDAVNGQPLVRLKAKAPEKTIMAVRNATGVVDLRARPLWREWAIDLVVRYDADQFTASDIANLIERAGVQIGIGEGRPYSKDSNGLGYGTFTIVRDAR